MDNITEHSKEIYEVEKIINCKIYKNKKYCCKRVYYLLYYSKICFKIIICYIFNKMALLSDI